MYNDYLFVNVIDCFFFVYILVKESDGFCLLILSFIFFLVCLCFFDY